MWAGESPESLESIDDTPTEPPIVQELRANGVPEWAIEQVKASYRVSVEYQFAVWHDNWQAINVFCECSNLWRMVMGMAGGVYLGLDWVQIHALFALKQQPLSATLIDDLQVMERSALTVLNKTN